jgi:FtsZ-binding cell division protein ZapB
MCEHTKQSLVPDLSAPSERQNAISPHQTSNSSHQSAHAIPNTNPASIGMLQLRVPVRGAPSIWPHHPLDGAAFPAMDHEPLNVSTNMAVLAQSARTPEDIRRMRRAESNRESAKRAKQRREQNLSSLERSLQEANDTVERLREEVKELKDMVQSLKENPNQIASTAHTTSPVALSEQGMQQAAADITFPFPFPTSPYDWNFED